MGDAAQVTLTGNNTGLEQKLGEALGMIQGWGGKVKSAIGVVAAAVAAKELFSFGIGLAKGAAEGEKGIILLDKTIDNLGKRTKVTSAEVQDFASDIQKLTTFNDDAAISAQALFLRLDKLDGDGIKRATIAAADLASVMGTELDAAAKIVAKAIETPEKAIEGLRAAGIAFTREEENMVKALVEAGDAASAQEIILSKLEQSIGGTAATVAQGSEGAWAVFSNRIADAGDSIGSFLLPILAELNPVIEWFSNFIEESVVPNMGSAINSVKEWGSWLGDYLGPMFTWLVDTGVWTFTALETAIKSWRDVGELAGKSFLLSMIKVYEGTKYFFAEALPKYLEWFGDNWVNIFTDIGRATVTILGNLWKNLTDFWAGLKDLMSGKGFTFTMTPLLEGFEAVTEALPEIAARAKTAYEQQLEGEISDLGEKISGAMAENLKKNRKALGLDKDPAKAPDKLPEGNLNPDAPKANADALAAATAVGKAAVAAKEKDAEKGKDAKEKSESGGSSNAGSFEDLVSLSKRIGSAAGGTSKDDKQVAATKDAADKQVAATEAVKAATEKVAAGLEPVREALTSILRVIPGVGGLTN